MKELIEKYRARINTFENLLIGCVHGKDYLIASRIQEAIKNFKEFQADLEKLNHNDQ